MTELQIVGVDTSLTDTGVARLRVDVNAHVLTRPVQALRVRTKATAKGDHPAMLTRLERIVADIRDTVTRGTFGLNADTPTPIAAAIEGPSYGSTGAAVHDIAGLWWLTYQMLVEVCDAVVVIPPATLKQYVTGKGNAAKDLVLMQTVRSHPTVEVSNNNEADALGMAAMVARQMGVPIEVAERVHMGLALERVAWPSLLIPRGVPGSYVTPQ